MGRLLCLIVLIGLNVGCVRVNFNFTGGNVDATLSTLFVDKFSNEADIVIPYLAQEVSQQLQERFLSQSRLTLTSGAADVSLSGSIVRFSVLPVAIQSSQTGVNSAAQNRLSIEVRVQFKNNVNPDDGWEQVFRGFTDFDADEDFSRVEREKINLVLEQITQDVFSKSIGKW
jgi:Lipopolysaccharide-assembly